MSESHDTRLDRYLAGELPAAEQRTLAQAALDDPELFDTLISTAAIKATAVGDARASVPPVIKRRTAWTFAGLAAAAAVVAFIAVYRSSSTSPSPDANTTAAPSANAGAVAVAEPPRAAFQPLILSARLNDNAATPATEFRTQANASRPPKNQGVIVAVEEGQVNVDLGSLDGLAKGSELQVFRGAGNSDPVGRVTIATVFRERARGTAAAALQAGDRVAVPPAIQFTALLEQVLARIAAGDASAASTLAAQAVAMSERPGIGSESADSLNELGAILIKNQDYPNAETILQRARMHAVGATAVRVANNLASLAALRGDVATAESLYQSALTLAGTSPEHASDRRSIEKNLQDLKAGR